MMMRNPAEPCQGGFTLVEMALVVGIIAVLTAVALPSLFEWQRSARLKSSARDIYGALQRARSEAVQRNQGVTAHFTLGAGPSGRVRLVDSSGAEIFRLPMPAQVEIASSDFASTTFDPRGMASAGGGVCVTNGRLSMNIILSGAGAVRMETVNGCL